MDPKSLQRQRFHAGTMTIHRVSTPPSTSKVDALPHELHELVLELALAVHKRGIYPETHPMLHGAVEGLVRRFSNILTKRSQLAFGVSRDRLIIDGVSTDDANPLLADLAGRLHEHELGGVTFLPGVKKQSLEDFIAAVSVSPVRGAEPLGRSRNRLARWSEILLTPMAFDRLELLGEEGEDGEPRGMNSRRSAELWHALARAALEGAGGVGGGGGWAYSENIVDGLADEVVESPTVVAQSIDRRVGNETYDKAILGFLREILGEIRDSDARDPMLRQKVSELVQNLDDATLRKLLHMGGNVAARGELLERANESLAAAAVVRMTKAAASESGESIAGSLLRLLSKLAKDAESRRPTGPTTDRALRGVIRRLLQDWKLIDPNPETYTVVLTDIATASPDAQPDLGRDGTEPDRILQIGIASGSKGPSVEAALKRVVASLGVSAAVDMLLAMDASPLRDEMVDRLINESTFREQLALEHPDIGMLQHAVDRLGVRAVEPLMRDMERREEADADWIVDLLGRIGPACVAYITPMIEAMPARALRHVIVLFDRVDRWPREFEPVRFARHPDVMVRREMVRFMLKREGLREQGVLAGLRDPDTRVFNLALGAASSGCTPEAARAAMRRLEDDSLGDELRARGVRVIAESRLGEVRAWLVHRATTRRWLFRTPRLRKPSLELFATLSALATYHAEDPEVQRLLALAHASRNTDIRRAATARVAPSTHL